MSSGHRVRRAIRKAGLAAGLAVGAILAFLYWPGLPLDLDSPPDLRLSVAESFGNDIGATGNVVGIEPFMETRDYATPERFEAKLRGYLDAARARDWLRPGTIVLLPEHLNTWLLVAGEKPRAVTASTTSAAMIPIIAWHPLTFLKNFVLFADADRAAAAVFRTKATETARLTADIYARLARDYGVWIAAGSGVMMTPGLYEHGALSYGHGPLFNAGFMFAPDGSPQGDAVRKVHPIPSETGFTRKARAASLPLFEIGSHRAGILICADSWFADTTGTLAAAGADVLLVPSFLTSDWDAPWGGYLNDAPPDTDRAGSEDDWRADVGRIREGDAWLKYALPAKARAHGIRYGMNVFLKGRLWEIEGDGRAIILVDGETRLGSGTKAEAALYNLWMK